MAFLGSQFWQHIILSGFYSISSIDSAAFMLPCSYLFLCVECRLLALATRFATEMIRIYGSLEYQKDGHILDGRPRTRILSLPPVSRHGDVMENSRRLSEMGYLLEITRNFQSRISRKFKKLGKVVHGINKLIVEIVCLLYNLTDDVCCYREIMKSH